MNKVEAKTKVRTVVKEGEEPQPIEVLESSIVEIAKAMKKLGSSRLKQETLVTLLHDHTKVSKREVRDILNSLEALEVLFLKRN
jgi:hypothetical protein